VNSAENGRGDIVKAGRMLAYEHAKRGSAALSAARGVKDGSLALMARDDYNTLNERFQAEHLVYCAKIACDQVGAKAPETFEQFKRQGQNFFRNERFFAALASLYQEIINPILPAVYSDAVSEFADVVEVGFGETAVITVESNDIPVFQDSSWGASRSVPRNYMYARDYVLNPTPRTAQVFAKWTQLVANGTDFGAFFANISAGMYAKTMGLFNAAMTSAASDPSLIPAALSYNFSNQNWATLANKLAAVNNTRLENLIAHGNTVALSKVLPTDATGTTNVTMDAALAEILGAEYTSTGYLGKFLGVRLNALMDAIVPGTQNTTIQTILPNNLIWMVASGRRKPMVIGMNRETPITLEIDPSKSGDMQIGINVTTALEALSVFSSKVGIVQV
jgi:hypothetical protein